MYQYIYTIYSCDIAQSAAAIEYNDCISAER